MADSLIYHSDKDAIYARVLYLVQNGSLLKEATEIVAEETGRTASGIRETYRRAGGNPDKDHGRNKLTNEQENILTSVCIVYSICHQALTVKDLVLEVWQLFAVTVSQTWCKYFLTRHHDALRAKKNKTFGQETHRQ